MRLSGTLLLAGWVMLHWLQCAFALTVEVDNPRAFREAFDNPLVDHIYLEDDLHLRPYNGWDRSKDGPVLLNRSVVIEGDPKWKRLLRVDYGDLLGLGHSFYRAQKENLSLTYHSVHLAGIPFLSSVPTTDEKSLTYFLNHSLIESYYPVSLPEPNWVAWLDYERAPEYPPLSGLLQAVKPVDKRFCDEWCKVLCPDANYVYLEDVAFHFGSVNVTKLEEMGLTMHDTGIFRAENSMLLLMAVDEWTPKNSEDFEAALESTRGHRTVINIEDSLKLWPSNVSCGANLTQNTVIKGSSSSVPPVDLLDFNLLLGCHTVPKGLTLTIQNLLLNNSIIDASLSPVYAPWQTVVGFFDVEDGGQMHLDNVVAHALHSRHSPLAAGSIAGYLFERGRVRMGTSLVTDRSTEQQVEVKDSKWCLSDFAGASSECVKKRETCVEHSKCPNNGVFIRDVFYAFPSASGGNAIYRITGSLLIPRELEEIHNPGGTVVEEGSKKGKTPKVIILVLVALAAVGCTIGVLALILAKMRHRAHQTCYEQGYDLPKQGSSISDTSVIIDGRLDGIRDARHGSLHRAEMSYFTLAAQKAAEKMFGNIVLGELLGQGGFGRVYKAAWNGAVVAVKVIEVGSESSNQESVIEREVNLLLELRHPNIVNLYQAAKRPTGLGYGNDTKTIKEELESSTPNSISSGSNPPDPSHGDGNAEAWMVMEFCDKGTLRDLIKNGYFFKDAVTKEPNMESVIRTCQDIARGFQYLHEQRMIHGDLKPHNILLQTGSQDARGFTAKIADFGVSRKLQGSQAYTGTVGTMTYMPPELLGQSKITSNTDVYAFGLIMWQLTSGEAPFSKVTAAEVWRKVVIENYRPTFDANMLPGYVHLAQKCWEADPKMRPSFDEVQSVLTSLLKARV